MRLAAPLLAVAILAGCGGGPGQTTGSSPSSRPAQTSTPSPTPPGTEPATAAPTPTTAPALAAIAIESPVEGSSVTVPFTVSGTADVFEAQFVLDLLDASGSVLLQQQVAASSGTGTRGTYSTRVTTDYRGPATLDLYDLSGTGDRIADVQVAVVIAG
jgi:hypothetical protein